MVSAVLCRTAQTAIPSTDRQEAARRTEGSAGKGCRLRREISRTKKRMPHCNDADSGSCRSPKGRRLPTGGGLREISGKVLPQAARTDTGPPGRQVTVLRTGSRKLSTNPYRKVGGEVFHRRNEASVVDSLDKYKKS